MKHGLILFFLILLLAAALSCTGVLLSGDLSGDQQKAVVETVDKKVTEQFPFFDDSYFTADGHLSGTQEDSEAWTKIESFKQKLDNIEKKIPYSDLQEFRRELTAAVASLGDGHTAVRLYYYGAYPGIQIRYAEKEGYYIERLSAARTEEDKL